MNRAMLKSPRALLHAARLADAVLFWPVLAYVLWGELQPRVPRALEGIDDKLLHFSAYFVLGAMAAAAIKRPGLVKWAIIGLIVVGAAFEIMQGYVGREPSVLDGVANGVGVIAGVGLARLILDLLRRRWGYDKDPLSP